MSGPFLSVSNVSAHLAGRAAIQSISLAVERGEHVGLVGPNGAGKSTLLRVMAGVLTADEGRVQLGILPIADLSLMARARSLSYLPQARELAWNMAVEDVVALGRFAYGGGIYEQVDDPGRAAIDAALTEAGAAEFVGRRVRELSGGEQARVHLARTLASGAEGLLLDEPCAGLDLRHQFELMEALEVRRVNGAAVVTAMHDLALAAEVCTRIIVLNEGQIVADGAPAQALTPSVLASVFGVRRSETGRFQPV